MNLESTLAPLELRDKFQVTLWPGAIFEGGCTSEQKQSCRLDFELLLLSCLPACALENCLHISATLHPLKF